MAIGALADMAQNDMKNRYNTRQQQRTFGMQKALNQQGSELALQMWKDTNFGAQRRELEKAGLNAGLLYGGSGGGGTTANTGSGGSAPSATPSQMEGMGMQSALMAGQLEMMKAQANKANAEAENIRGVGKDNTIEDTNVKSSQAELIKLQSRNQEILNNINNMTSDDVINTVKANYNKAEGEASKAIAEGRYSEGTAKANMEKLQQEALNSIFQGTAIKAGIKLTEEQTRKISEELAQGWEELYQKARANDNQKGMVNIAGFKAKLDEILGKANIDLRAKELMLRGAEAFVGSLGKKSTTNSHTSTPNGETYHSSTTTTR